MTLELVHSVEGAITEGLEALGSDVETTWATITESLERAGEAIAKAANNTIAPCAKLKTPDALKISTKPKATSEYSMPAMSPPSKVSKKNAMIWFPVLRGA